MAVLRIGSRGSELALWQAEHVAGQLRARGHQVSIEVIRTTGDRMAEAAFAQVGTKGMFVKEIEEALAGGRIDLAVHSLKDVATGFDPAFELAAILPREDARDAFVSVNHGSWRELPAGAVVGTSSLRRQSQLKALRGDIEVRELRGNVNTRLRKLAAGDYHAILLAHAGLKRLARTEAVREVLAPEVMCPAPGQGALAIETRSRSSSDDARLRALLGFFDDAATRDAVTCERELLSALGGGCQVPIGAYAECDAAKNETMRLMAVVLMPDGSRRLRARGEGSRSNPAALGRRVAEDLLQQGARAILDQVEGLAAPAPQQP